jgi:hypothetical protein
MSRARTLCVIAAAFSFVCGDGDGAQSSDSGVGEDAGQMSDAGPAGSDAGTSTFVAFGSSASTVNLVWSEASGATAYLLERQLGGGAFSQVKTLGAGARNFLDSGLAAQTTYSYRLTAQGASADAVREYAAVTSNEDVLSTTADTPLGAPAQQTIGSAGGTVSTADQAIVLTVPAGAVPDGTNIALQPIVNPLPQETSAAVSIDSDTPFAKDVSLLFHLADGDSPDAASVALQDASGVWLSSYATVDATAGTLTVTLPAEAAASAAMRRAATRPAPRKVLRFARFFVAPRAAYVKLNGKATFTANALFSDDRCDTKADPEGCAWVVEFIRILQGNAAIAQGLTMPLPQHGSKPVPNSLGTWALDPAGDPSGTIAVQPTIGVQYTAPGTKPAAKPVLLKFTPIAPSSGKTLFSDPAQIWIRGDNFRISAVFNATNFGINEAINATVRDEFETSLEIGVNNQNQPEIFVSQTTDHDSVYSNAVCADPTAKSFTLDGTYDLIDISTIEATYENHLLTLGVNGTGSEVSATLNYGQGITVTFPGGSGPTFLGLNVQVDLDNLVTAQTFDTFPATNWKITIDPFAPP